MKIGDRVVVLLDTADCRMVGEVGVILKVIPTPLVRYRVKFHNPDVDGYYELNFFTNEITVDKAFAVRELIKELNEDRLE